MKAPWVPIFSQTRHRANVKLLWGTWGALLGYSVWSPVKGCGWENKGPPAEPAGRGDLYRAVADSGMQAAGLDILYLTELLIMPSPRRTTASCMCRAALLHEELEGRGIKSEPHGCTAIPGDPTRDTGVFSQHCSRTESTAWRRLKGMPCKMKEIKKAYVCAKLLQMCPTVRSHGLKLVRLLCPWDIPGKNTGVGCHGLLQGIFLTQG